MAMMTDADACDVEPAAKHHRPDLTEDEAGQLLRDAVPKKTRQSTEFWVRVVKGFSSEKGLDVNLETDSEEKLDSFTFYSCVRTAKGELYQRSGYISARAAIQRHLIPLGRDVTIFASQSFQASNAMLDAVLKANKRDGKERKVQHKKSISAEDKMVLAAYLEDVLFTNDTWKLQEFVWYCFSLHFDLRGAEVFTKLKKDDLCFRKNDKGEYLELSCDFHTNNTPGGLRGREFSFSSAGQIHDPKQLSVVRRLLEVLHPLEPRIFQRALAGHKVHNGKKEGIWFVRVPLGHNSISDIMPKLSICAGLSRRTRIIAYALRS